MYARRTAAIPVVGCGLIRDARLSALSLRSATSIAYYDLMRAMGSDPEKGR